MLRPSEQRSPSAAVGQPDEERDVLRSAAVFVGGFDLEAFTGVFGTARERIPGWF